MKHTDFHSLVKKIKEQERKELINAVIAHGGSYDTHVLQANSFRGGMK